ncbi:MAG: hypothetical protein P8Z78_15170 [Gammaproteobacteria bacterium]|jgi:hypothetical protein
MPEIQKMQQKMRLMESPSARLVLAILAVLGVLLAATGAADRSGREYLNNSMQRTLVTFGIARTINGVISVAQGTEVAIEPAGIGVNFAPGEILDPVNDMIERFSWVMLSATASLGLQQLLSELSEWLPVTLIYAISGLAVLLVLLLHSRTPDGVRLLVLRFFVLLTIARFLIPAVSVTAESIHSGFLQPRYDAAVEKLESSSDRLGNLNEAAQPEIPEESGVLDSLRQFFDSAQTSLDVETRLDQYKEVAADITNTSVELIVIFLFQALLLPLAVVWFGTFLFRSTMRLLQ